MDYENLTDEQLVQLFKSGDEKAFEYLYKRYEKGIKGYARTFYLFGVGKEDLWQEGFLALYSATMKFDGEIAQRNGATFGTFAYSYIKYRMLGAVEKTRGNTGGADVTDESLESIPEDSPSPEEIYISHETKNELFEIIKQNLSEFEKSVFDLYVEDYKYTEIAAMLGVSPKTVDNALHRIKEKCKKSRVLRLLYGR